MDKNNGLPNGWGSGNTLKLQGWGANSGQKPAWGNPQPTAPKETPPANKPIPENTETVKPITESKLEAPAPAKSAAEAAPAEAISPTAEEPAAAAIVETPAETAAPMILENPAKAAVPVIAEVPAETAPPAKQAEHLQAQAQQAPRPGSNKLPVILLSVFLGLAIIAAVVFAVLFFAGSAPADSTDPSPSQTTEPTQGQTTPQEDYSAWLGAWQIRGNTDDELFIHRMSESTITFSIDWPNRGSALFKVVATREKGQATFNYYDPYTGGGVTGQLILGEAGIIAVVTSYGNDFIPTGSWTFSEKRMSSRHGHSCFDQPATLEIVADSGNTPYYSMPSTDRSPVGYTAEWGSTYTVAEKKQVALTDGSTQTWVLLRNMYEDTNIGWIPVAQSDSLVVESEELPVYAGNQCGACKNYAGIAVAQMQWTGDALVFKVFNNDPPQITSLFLQLNALCDETGTTKTSWDPFFLLENLHQELTFTVYFSDLCDAQKIVLTDVNAYT